MDKVRKYQQICDMNRLRLGVEKTVKVLDINS
jgi:hypothetical protein